MMNEESKDRRKGIRVDFATDVSVTVEGVETHYKGNSRDLSLRGVYIKTDRVPAENTVCQVAISLQGLEEDVLLSMEGRVVRTGSDGYAIYFDSVDLDTYTHLKNIVRYNSPDSDGV